MGPSSGFRVHNFGFRFQLGFRQGSARVFRVFGFFWGVVLDIEGEKGEQGEKGKMAKIQHGAILDIFQNRSTLVCGVVRFFFARIMRHTKIEQGCGDSPGRGHASSARHPVRGLKHPTPDPPSTPRLHLFGLCWWWANSFWPNPTQAHKSLPSLLLQHRKLPRSMCWLPRPATPRSHITRVHVQNLAQQLRQSLTVSLRESPRGCWLPHSKKVVLRRDRNKHKREKNNTTTTHHRHHHEPPHHQRTNTTPLTFCDTNNNTASTNATCGSFFTTSMPSGSSTALPKLRSLWKLLVELWPPRPCSTKRRA